MNATTSLSQTNRFGWHSIGMNIGYNVNSLKWKPFAAMELGTQMLVHPDVFQGPVVEAPRKCGKSAVENHGSPLQRFEVSDRGLLDVKSC